MSTSSRLGAPQYLKYFSSHHLWTRCWRTYVSLIYVQIRNTAVCLTLRTSVKKEAFVFFCILSNIFSKFFTAVRHILWLDFELLHTGYN
jgi:hypothetical protein